MTSSRSFFGNHFLVGAGWRERERRCAAAAAGFDIKAAATHDALLRILGAYKRTGFTVMSTHTHTPVVSCLDRMYNLSCHVSQLFPSPSSSSVGSERKQEKDGFSRDVLPSDSDRKVLDRNIT